MEFMETLLFIKNTCETADGCSKCPFGKYIKYDGEYTCGITYCDPCDWELNGKTIVKCFKDEPSEEWGINNGQTF